MYNLFSEIVRDKKTKNVCKIFISELVLVDINLFLFLRLSWT